MIYRVKLWDRHDQEVYLPLRVEKENSRILHHEAPQATEEKKAKGGAVKARYES